jgi:DNA-binding GntR family transcriptional regulator
MSSEFSQLNVSAVGSHPQLMNVVTSELRRLIIEFELAPGTHLVEAKLAKMLGVSRNPVREAIRVLAAEGFVHVTPRRGAFVAHLTAEDAENLFEVRLGLEPVGARLAARHGPSAGVQKLAGVIARAHGAMAANRLELLPNLITEFHLGVFELAHNPFLLTVAIPTIKRAQWVHLPDLSQRAPHTWTEHTELMRAIEAGDEAGAERQARDHVEAARKAYRERGHHAKHAAAEAVALTGGT